jgi:ATP-dependent exoDNAse (exonuclease V) alpha subunit
MICSCSLCVKQSSNHGNLKQSQTVHKWAGLEDGKHMNEVLVHLIRTDERFVNVKKNIESTDILFVDEVSMISTKILDQH